jgi:DNA-binding GntR family transcriptional regulator
MAQIDSIIQANPRMSTKHIAEIISLPPSQEVYSSEFVRRARSEMKYHFLPPIDTFVLTDLQIQNRLAFAHLHLQTHTDWSTKLFVDESSFWLNNDHRWVWRCRGDKRDSVRRHLIKYQK